MATAVGTPFSPSQRSSSAAPLFRLEALGADFFGDQFLPPFPDFKIVKVRPQFRLEVSFGEFPREAADMQRVAALHREAHLPGRLAPAGDEVLFGVD